MSIDEAERQQDKFDGLIDPLKHILYKGERIY